MGCEAGSRRPGARPGADAVSRAGMPPVTAQDRPGAPARWPAIWHRCRKASPARFRAPRPGSRASATAFCSTSMQVRPRFESRIVASRSRTAAGARPREGSSNITRCGAPMSSGRWRASVVHHPRVCRPTGSAVRPGAGSGLIKTRSRFSLRVPRARGSMAPTSRSSASVRVKDLASLGDLAHSQITGGATTGSTPPQSADRRPLTGRRSVDFRLLPRGAAAACGRRQTCGGHERALSSRGWRRRRQHLSTPTAGPRRSPGPGDHRPGRPVRTVVKIPTPKKLVAVHPGQR
jgi:hypothetical protein